MFNPIADFITMRREITSRSKLLSAWGFMLNVPTLLGGLWFVNTIEGGAVVFGILVSLLIATQIYKRHSLTRLMAVCHVVFLPAIALLGMKVAAGVELSLFGIWSVYSLLLMSICVVIDCFDLYRYFFQGNKTYVSG